MVISDVVVVPSPSQQPRTYGSTGRSATGSSSGRSEEHTSELQSHSDLVCRLLLEKKNNAERVGERERSARDDLRERLALDQFHHQHTDLGSRFGRAVLEPVDLGDALMSEGSQELC